MRPMIRQFRRKFSISAPRLSVRPHVPWYVRWAIALPFLLVIALTVWWAYDSGLELAGFHRGQAESELNELRERVQFLEGENANLANQVAAYERQGQIAQQTASTGRLRWGLPSLVPRPGLKRPRWRAPPPVPGREQPRDSLRSATT